MTDSSETGSYPSSWKKAPFIKNSFVRWLIIVGGAIYLAAALGTMNIDLERVKEGLPRAQRFLDSFFPPNFSDNRGVLWEGIAESVWMAIISTVAGELPYLSQLVSALPVIWHRPGSIYFVEA